MSEELKNCPFCGGADIWVPHPADTNTWVVCETCRAEGPIKDTGREAITAWNSRAGEKA